MTNIPVLEHLDRDGVVITANRRLARSLQHAYQLRHIRAGLSVWQTPLILPIDAWLQRVHEELLASRLVDFRLIDQEQVRQLWQQLLQSDETAAGLLNPIKTAAGLAAAWRTQCEYESAADQSPDFTLESLDLQLYARLQRDYQQQLQKLNVCDLAALPRRLESVLPEILPELLQGQLQSRAETAPPLSESAADSAGLLSQAASTPPLVKLCNGVLLTGFARLSPRLQRLFTVIDAVCGVQVLPLNEGEFWSLERSQGSLSLISENPSEAGTNTPADPAGGEQESRLPSAAYQFAAENQDDELFRVAHWCRDIIEQQSRLSTASGSADLALPKIAVIVFDLAGRRLQLQRIFDEVFFPTLSPQEKLLKVRPYDIGLGSSLADWPIVKAALLAIELSIEGLSGVDLSWFLTNPYCSNGDTTSDDYTYRVQFDNKLRTAGVYHADLQQLLAADSLPRSLQRSLKRIRQPKYEKGNAAYWCQHFSSVLDAFRWPGDALGSHEYQAFRAWQEALRGYSRIAAVVGSHSAPEALQTLRRLLAESKFQPQTGELPIQIVSPNDSIGLDYDYLWVCGMDTVNWPGTVRPDPWLPRAWQKEVQVPGNNPQQLALDAQLLWQTWQFARCQAVFSYAEERDEQEVSAALPIEGLEGLEDLKEFESLQAVPQSALPEDSRSGSAFKPSREHIQQALSLEVLSDGNGPVIGDGSVVKGGARFFEDQSLCAFRAFALHRLRVRPLEETGPGIDSRVRGTALHCALELFWKRVVDHAALVQLDLSSLSQLISTCIDEAFESSDLAGKLHQSPQLLALEKERLQALLEYWLAEIETAREAFEVIATEQQTQLQLESLTFNLTVDRIDRLASGESVVLDYKTGANNSPGGWTRDRILNPQLPLYATIRDDISALAFAQVTRAEPRFKGLAEAKDLLPGVGQKRNARGMATAVAEAETWTDIIDFWKAATLELAGNIKAGRAVVDPQPSACHYCDLAGLCRIDPLRLEVLEQAALEGATDE